MSDANDTIALGDGAGDSVNDSGNSNKIKVGNGSGDVVNDSGYSNTITLGNGVSDKVTNSGGDTITLGNGAGDMVSTGNTLDDAGSTITLGNGADDSLNATIVPTYTCTSFNNPSSSYATDALGINDLGQIVGRYESSTVPNAPSQDDAFLDSGDAFTSIAVPGAINFSTEAWGINDAGQIVGDYEDSTLSTQSFLYSGGTYSQIDVPGSYDTTVSGSTMRDRSSANTTSVL